MPRSVAGITVSLLLLFVIPALFATSIAKPRISAQMKRAEGEVTYKISIKNTTPSPVYLLLTAIPDVKIDDSGCWLTLTTEAAKGTFPYSFSPTVLMLKPNKSTSFSWPLPEKILKDHKCENAELMFAIAYLTELPPSPLTAQYAEEHQVITSSDWYDYP